MDLPKYRDELAKHIGHDLVCVDYEKVVTIECKTCTRSPAHKCVVVNSDEIDGALKRLAEIETNARKMLDKLIESVGIWESFKKEL